MKVTHPGCSIRDARGDITDVLAREEIDCVTLITSR